MSNYVTEYVPEWKNLRLEYTDGYVIILKVYPVKKYMTLKL